MQPHLFGIDSVLLTNRTVIRRFREGDGAAFFDLLQDNSAVLGDEFAELLEEASDKERA
ncbi:MAG: N-acetyltransferase, partial [Saprospiraceae bacterium]|nr:N-acetyltransferase [Saprospiraceae bacterium]